MDFMYYKCLKYKIYSEADYSLVPLREIDILLIKDWRNDQIEVLRQKMILSDEDQIHYYKNHILPAFDAPLPRQIIFSFLKKNKCIGYGGLTNIDWESKRAELSFLVDTARTRANEIYEKDFSFFLKLIKQVVFDDLGFNRLFTETFDIRPLHITVLEKSGFRFEGRMKEHVIIDNKFVDSLLHGFIKKDYESQK
jgi:RimJ/RimL family protein N-acetyltransferase